MVLKTYKVELSQKASRQIDDIHHYISYQLQAPLAAVKTVHKLIYATNRLSVFPHAGFDVDSKLGFRLNKTHKTFGFVEGKFLVFYTIHEEDDLVLVSHILDSRSDYLSLLLERDDE